MSSFIPQPFRELLPVPFMLVAQAALRVPFSQALQGGRPESLTQRSWA